jgi:hypothetical protein
MYEISYKSKQMSTFIIILDIHFEGQL